MLGVGAGGGRGGAVVMLWIIIAFVSIICGWIVNHRIDRIYAYALKGDLIGDGRKYN
jgi:hypothetical protein